MPGESSERCNHGRQDLVAVYLDLIRNHPQMKALKTFVETGTFQAETVRKMERFFDQLITIEIDPKLHAAAQNKHPSPKIRYIRGDSVGELRKLAQELQQPALFYLDAHFSGEGTGRGSKDVPLIEEMKILGKRNQPDCIIVDDLRLFGTHRNQEDWSAVTRDSILQAIGTQELQFFEQGDKLILLRSPESHLGHPKYL
jgi:hypothetical protein